MDGTPFSEMELRDKPLKDCELVFDGKEYRMWINRRENGFDAMAVRFISCTSDGNFWDCPNLEVEQLFKVTAYFDGVRHLEFNCDAGDMAGYIYYPNMPELIKLFQKLREIEVAECREVD